MNCVISRKLDQNWPHFVVKLLFDKQFYDKDSITDVVSTLKCQLLSLFSLQFPHPWCFSKLKLHLTHLCGNFTRKIYAVRAKSWFIFGKYSNNLKSFASFVSLCLRSFHCFAVRSSAHGGKIIIFERFHCSLTNIIQFNWQLVKIIRKIEICLIWANFCELVHFSDILCKSVKFHFYAPRF